MGILATVITVSSSLVYLAGTAVTFRVLHIKRMSEFLRWKNEDPEEIKTRYLDGYYSIEKSRSTYTFYQYMDCVNLNLPRYAAFAWPFFAPWMAVRKFCVPEVKIPDQTKIKELEKL